MTSTITLRTELHPSGSLMMHAGSIAGIRVEAHQNEQAHNARAAGSWFLTIGVAGHPLRCHSQHRTLGDARAFAADVIAAAGEHPSHAQLLDAHDRVENPQAVIDLDAGVVDVEPAAPAGPIVVVPCGAGKLDHAAPAADLYTSQHFALTLRAARKLAEDQGARVFILSALHGLLDPATVVEPYNVKMGDRGCITPAALADQLAAINPTTITSLLPKAYRLALVRAGAVVNDLYANAPGIGYQRGIAAKILSSRQHATAVDPAGHVYEAALF